MARRVAVLALFLMFLPIFASAQQTEAKKETTTTEDDGGETAIGVRSAMQSYIKAFQEKDIDGVMAAFADAPNTVMMGTGPDEVWLGKDDIRTAHYAFFANSKKETSESTLVSVGANGGVAWLTGYFVVTKQNAEGQETYQLNLSLVLERAEDTWYITAMHFSNLTGAK